MIGSVSSWDAPDPVLTQFLDTLRDGVVVVGSDLHIKYFNASHARQLEIEGNSLFIGQHLRDSLIYLAKQDRLGDTTDRTPEAIADERMGGTYLTVLNTVSQMIRAMSLQPKM